jgi:hypothetical protein
MQGLETILRLTKVADKKRQDGEASHVGGLFVDDFSVWLVGDEPVTKSAGKAGMRGAIGN